MKALVTVFKSELKTRQFAIMQLRTLCKEINENQDGFTFSPKDCKLVEFLNVLKFHKIVYGTHFDTMPELEKIRV